MFYNVNIDFSVPILIPLGYQVVKSLKEMDPAELSGFSQRYTKMTVNEELQFTLSEKPAQQNVTDSQEQVNQLHSSDTVPVGNLGMHKPLTTTSSQGKLQSSSPSHLQQVGGDPNNQTHYMPLNTLSLESEGMYMAPSVTSNNQNVNVPGQVEEFYDMPLPKEPAQVDEMYDIVDTSSPSSRQIENPPLEEDHYYI